MPGSIETGRWYEIRIEVHGAQIRCYLDGKLIHDVQPAMKAMYAVASRASESGDVISRWSNADGEPRTAAIELAGLDGKVTLATATVLTSASPEDENTLEEPTKVVPAVSQPISNASAHFRHTFPAHLVTVLQIKVEK